MNLLQNKKNMKYIISIAICLGLFFVASCSEGDKLTYSDGSLPAPKQISDIKIKNIPGGAILNYKLPDDKNLLYVKAEYEIREGVRMETKVSYYSDTLTVEGFGKSGTYPVKIYTVGRNEKASEPMIVEVSPMTPPVELAFPDLVLDEAFGGIRFSFKNEYEKDFSFTLLADTLNAGVWEPLQTFYSKSSEGNFSYSGLDSIPMRFGLYIQDRWSNRSDTLMKTLTPLFEEDIPKPYGQFNLPSDTYLPVEDLPAYGIQSLWDKVTSNVNGNIFATKHTSPMPQTFTVDLQHTAVISRIKVHQRSQYEYTGSNVRIFELYGSNSTRPGDDLFGGDWILLGKFESWKPSGPGAVTQEDRDYANVQGENFELVPTIEVPNPWVPVRYVRFRTMETYNGPSMTGQITVAEITISGQIQKEE